MEINSPLALKIVMFFILTCLIPTYAVFEVNVVLKQGKTAIAPVHDPFKVKGVLDRLEDHHKAVILVEELNKEIIVSEHLLPEGSRANMWFSLTLRNKDVVAISIDWQSTWKEINKAQVLIEELRK